MDLPLEPEQASPSTLELWLNRASRAALGIAVGIVGALAVIFLFFALPSNDDFVRATRPRELGWWGYVFGFTYMKWQGRWSSCGLESAVLPRLEITQYYWVLIGAIVLVHAIGAYIALRYLARSTSRRTATALAAVLLALRWAGTPSVAEAVYWFTGAVENALVISLAVLLVVWVCGSGAVPVPKIVMLAVFAFVIVGFHELYGSMLWMVLAAGTALAFWCRTTNRMAWLLVTLAATVGLAVVVLAPGNSVRLATDGGPHNRQIVFAYKIAMSQLRFYPKWWLLDPKLIAATIWVACSPTNSKRVTDRALVPEIAALENRNFSIAENGPRSVQKNLLWICPVVWVGMLLFGFYLPSWAFAAAMPGRTLSANYFVFVGGWLLIVYLWTRWLREPRISDPSPSMTMPFRVQRSRWSTIAAHLAEVGLAISLLLTGHVRDALIDLRDNITPWHDAVQDRYAFLQRFQGTDARVPPLPSAARLLLAGEIVTPGPRIFTTSIMAYFGLRSFHVIPPPEKDPAPRR